MEECKCGGLHVAIFYSYFVAAGSELVLEEVTGRNHICISVRAKDVVYYFDFSVGQKVPNARRVLGLVKEQGYADKYHENDVQVYSIACVCSADKNRIVRLDWECISNPNKVSN